MLTRLRAAISGWITYLVTVYLIPKKVGAVMRLVFKIPVLFYRLRMPWMVPRRILILVTTGRRTGKPRCTALEYGYDGRRYFLMSGWKGKSDWYRNALANPRVQVWLGRQRMTCRAEPATNEETAQEMEAILKIFPAAVNIWARCSGVQYDGSRASLLRMAEALPSIKAMPEQGSSQAD